MSDSSQVILHLLLLPFELLRVGQYLPFAAAAHAVVLAHRLAALLRRLHHTCHARLHKRVLLLRHLQIDDVARHAVRHKAHHVCLLFSVSVSGLYSTKRLAFRRHVGDLDIGQ